MSLTLVTAPDKEPVTLEDAKAQLRIDFDEDDAMLRNLIKAARQYVEGQTKKSLVSTTWDQTIDWCWPNEIRLERNPLISVDSITYNNNTSPMTTLDASKYTVVSRDHGSYIVPAYNEDWPDIIAVPEAIRVRFTAGYSTIPEPLKHAITMLVAHWYETRIPVLAGQGQVLIDIPYTVEALISPYRPGL